MSNYRQILEEFIRNRNPNENSTAGILSTPQRAPMNKWDFGGPLGNIADAFANRQLGQLEDDKQRAQDIARLRLPSGMQKLGAIEGIFGPQLAALSQKQDESNAQNAAINNAAFNQQLSKKTADLMPEFQQKRIAIETKLKELKDPNSMLNRGTNVFYNAFANAPGNKSKLLSNIEAIDKGDLKKGINILGVPIFMTNDGKINGIVDAFKKSGYRDPRLLEAATEMERLIGSELNDLRKVTLDLSGKQMDSNAERSAVLGMLRGYITGNQMEVLNDLYQKAYNVNTKFLEQTDRMYGTNFLGGNSIAPASNQPQNSQQILQQFGY